MSKTVASACVRNCCLNENDICIGCHHSLYEIKLWMSSTEDEKQEIINRISIGILANSNKGGSGL